MITRVFLAPRRQDMTTEACLQHWRGHHAAIGARLPGVRAYVQNHGVLDGGRFLLPYPGFDIMPELDWDDLAAMDAAIDSPVHERDSVDDEENFIDTSRTGLAVTTRHVLVDGAPAGVEAVKLITFFRRAPAASDKQSAHGPNNAPKPVAFQHVKITSRPARAGRTELPRRQDWAVSGLLLPGALLMTMRAQLLAPFMLIDLCLSTFLK